MDHGFFDNKPKKMYDGVDTAKYIKWRQIVQLPFLSHQPKMYNIYMEEEALVFWKGGIYICTHR